LLQWPGFDRQSCHFLLVHLHQLTKRQACFFNLDLIIFHRVFLLGLLGLDVQQICTRNAASVHHGFGDAGLFLRGSGLVLCGALLFFQSQQVQVGPDHVCPQVVQCSLVRFRRGLFVQGGALELLVFAPTLKKGDITAEVEVVRSHAVRCEGVGVLVDRLAPIVTVCHSTVQVRQERPVCLIVGLFREVYIQNRVAQIEVAFLRPGEALLKRHRRLGGNSGGDQQGKR
jgi:hypothetical protein